MENKQAICDALLTTLQLTRRYEDIQSIDYDAAAETVTVTYNDISHRYINVECDSGIAMIQDILKSI
jgi:hypothetical protein|nr:MAG TPA: KTSC domain [Caudoviricetes sp.]